MKKLFVSLAIVMMLFTSVPKSEALIITGPVLGFTAVKTAPVWGPYVITGFLTTATVCSKVITQRVVPHVAPYIPSVIQKKGGGQDHRYNRGLDRTPAQRRGDAARRK